MKSGLVMDGALEHRRKALQGGKHGLLHRTSVSYGDNFPQTVGPMLSHSAIWDAIDGLAARHGFTASGLAKLAGLDATAFNRSKRVSRDGRERWPSTESISNLLEATGESFDVFLSAGGAYLQSGSTPAGATVPLLGLAQAGAGGFFDAAGFPTGEGWD